MLLASSVNDKLMLMTQKNVNKDSRTTRVSPTLKGKLKTVPVSEDSSYQGRFYFQFTMVILTVY